MKKEQKGKILQERTQKKGRDWQVVGTVEMRQDSGNGKGIGGRTNWSEVKGEKVNDHGRETERERERETDVLSTSKSQRERETMSGQERDL